MSNKTLVTIGDTTPSLPTSSEWNLMLDMARNLIPTGFLPQALNTPEKALAVMLKGRELGIPAMYAMSNIVIVKGKPTCSAELMLALVQRDRGPDSMWVEETTNEKCTVGYRVGGKAKFYSFTMDDAQKAGLSGSDTYRKYPAAMLRARCISAVARMFSPGSIGGLYSYGETGGDVEVDEDTGEITVPTSWSKPEPTTATIEAPPERPSTITHTTTKDFGAAVQSKPQNTSVDANHQQAMRALHACGSDNGLDHDTLRAYAIALSEKYDNKTITSMTEAPTGLLVELTRRIDNNLTSLRAEFPEVEIATNDYDIVDAEIVGQGSIDPSLLPTDAELRSADSYTR